MSKSDTDTISSMFAVNRQFGGTLDWVEDRPPQDREFIYVVTFEGAGDLRPYRGRAGELHTSVVLGMFVESLSVPKIGAILDLGPPEFTIQGELHVPDLPEGLLSIHRAIINASGKRYAFTRNPVTDRLVFAMAAIQQDRRTAMSNLDLVRSLFKPPTHTRDGPS